LSSGFRKIHADPRVQGLENLKPGDDVSEMHTQAVCISSIAEP
jgi:hypothetical protein